MSTLLFEKMKTLGIELSEKQIKQFDDYYHLLIQWNQVMNLTAITEYSEVMEKHFVDSLALIKVMDQEKLRSGNLSLIDVGTGAGFPGLPIKIVFPDIKLTLLDSLNKRIKFLNEVVRKLKLTDVNLIHGRAEDFAKKKEYREQYDLCVSRAVANLSTLSEYCIPYIKRGGFFLSYKSGEIEEEIRTSQQAIKILGGNIDYIEKFQLPGTDINRTIIKIVKNKSTPGKYPRKAGMPAKEPLK